MRTETPELRTLVSDGLIFPESPRWHDGTLWLSDMHAHRVVRVADDGTVTPHVEIDDKPAGIGFLGDETPVVVSMRHCAILRLATTGPEIHADLRKIPGVVAVNDMVCLPDGTIYTGARVSPDAAPDGAVGIIVHVLPTGAVGGVYPGLKGPNGLAVTPDGHTLVVAETRSNALTAFEIAGDGSLSNCRLFADLGHLEPDGICLDADGAVWTGCVFAGEFLRVHEGGRVSHRITLDDGAWAVACMLGGPDRDRLYLVCAHETMANVRACADFEADRRSTARGFLMRTDVEVPGAGWPG